MVSPGPSVRINKGRRRGKRKLHRPQDIREGVSNAYYIVKDVSKSVIYSQNTIQFISISTEEYRCIVLTFFFILLIGSW